MMYGALIGETGEILECADFKTVYHAAVSSAKGELYAPWLGQELDVVVIEFFKFTDTRTIHIEGSKYPMCGYIGEEHIAYVAVSQTGMTIDCPSGVFDIDRAGWKSKQS